MTRIADLPDPELVRRIADGDEQAFEALFRRRYAGLHRFARHMLGCPQRAEDVVQEVFLALARQAQYYDERRGSVATYLYGIARHQVRRLADRDVPAESIDTGGPPIEAGVGDPLAHLLDEERTARVRGAIAALPAHYREVVVLCDLLELDYAGAAAALGRPVGTVRSRLHRARALLVAKLRGADAAPGMVAALRQTRCSS